MSTVSKKLEKLLSYSLWATSYEFLNHKYIRKQHNFRGVDSVDRNRYRYHHTQAHCSLHTYVHIRIPEFNIGKKNFYT